MFPCDSLAFLTTSRCWRRQNRKGICKESWSEPSESFIKVEIIYTKVTCFDTLIKY